jgi:hypothetical protein
MDATLSPCALIVFTARVTRLRVLPLAWHPSHPQLTLTVTDSTGTVAEASSGRG